ncbi:hypothetical protein BKA58DRAFT_168818 [Alternaria rosae]|uniref:uncharacterized protein n=1 Tax=Alternaria rosae TaxID=1187941 RepID=UPI001E8D892E|nr:uncharacterized protein BKA58DRAFT_168818 [Alternaria rosae]KAH6869982.1 hypothetical protein BKA58DRAFT_168818 [Alternaria rosae]
MAEIYANAYVTLVAIAGCTVDFGLPDNIEQWIYQCPVMNKPTRYDKHFHDTRVRNAVESPETVWNTQGWIFQERWFAGRLMYFLSTLATHENLGPPYFGQDGSDYVSWDYQRAWWHDIRDNMTDELDKRLNSASLWPSIGPITWPDFSRYASEVTSYVPRYLTYDSDVVPAFAGTASALAKTFPGGFLYGLPIIYFDVALMWMFNEIQAIRTIDTKSDESLRAPNWSGMSWRAELAYHFWNSLFDFLETTPVSLSIHLSSGVVFSPLVRWSYIGAIGARIAIENGYHKYRYFAHDSESTPPLGWDRITPSTASSDIQQTFRYTTPAAPGQIFRFPIPLVDPSTITIPKPISNVITGQTERAYFYLAGERVIESWGVQPILDSNGHYSGRFWGFGGTDGPTKVNQKIQLIAMSNSPEGNIDDCYGKILRGDRCTKNRTGDGVKERYNVLWIEWTHGIAYRKAVGQVTKEAWEAADRELIDFVLG